MKYNVKHYPWIVARLEPYHYVGGFMTIGEAEAKCRELGDGYVVQPWVKQRDEPEIKSS